MLPYLYRGFGIAISSYSIFYGAALVIGGVAAGIVTCRNLDEGRKYLTLWFLTCVAAVVGARTAFIVIYGGHLWSSSHESDGGEVLYGGIMAGLLLGISLSRLLDVPLGRLADGVSIGLPLGIAVGRLGCLACGCCYGIPCKVPWLSIQYPKTIDVSGAVVSGTVYAEHLQAGIIGPDADRSAPVFAVPIFESIVCCAIAAMLAIMWRRRVLRGRLLGVSVGLYAAWRFVAETLRRRDVWHADVLSLYQWISVIVVISAATFVAISLTKRVSLTAR